ncbi:MAG: T9SS type A sorting domain-containing protein [Ferruginibacter sp.]
MMLSFLYFIITNNSIQLFFNKKQDNIRLTLFRASEQLIRSATSANNITTYAFELPPLATGVYMLQLINKKMAYSKKIFIAASY